MTFKGNPGNEWQGRRPPPRPYICTTVSIFDVADMPFPLAAQGGLVFKLNSSPDPSDLQPVWGADAGEGSKRGLLAVSDVWGKGPWHHDLELGPSLKY